MDTANDGETELLALIHKEAFYGVPTGLGFCTIMCKCLD